MAGAKIKVKFKPGQPKSKPDQWQGVSNTAHFTAAVWEKAGVPGAAHFVTRKGHLLYALAKYGGAICGFYGKYGVARLFLIPRYLGIEAVLAQHNPTQIIELAAGLAPRGSQWVQTHRGSYIEIDQARVIALKQKILAPLLAQLPPDVSYRLIAANILEDELKAKIQSSAQPLESGLKPDFSTLSPQFSTLIICEGMTGYLDEPTLGRLLTQIRELAASFQDCTILLDLYLKPNIEQHRRLALVMSPLELFLRFIKAPARLFLRDAGHIRNLLEAAGFELQHLYPAHELTALAHLAPPPFDIFYLAQLKVSSK